MMETPRVQSAAKAGVIAAGTVAAFEGGSEQKWG